MCGSMVDIQSAAAEIRRGIKKDGKKPQGKNIMSASATQGGHKKHYNFYTLQYFGAPGRLPGPKFTNLGLNRKAPSTKLPNFLDFVDGVTDKNSKR